MYLASGSNRLSLYDLNSWDLKKIYGGYDGIVRDVSWSDDGKYILQVNAKGLVEILSPADHEIRSLQHIPLKDTWSASFHREGHRNVAIGTKYGNVLIWDTKNKTITKTFPVPSHQSSVNFISYNCRNTCLAANMQNGDTAIYSLVSNISVCTVKLHCSKSISGIKFHPESRSLLGLATDEGHIILRDVTTNKDKAFFENAHASPVSDIAYSLINKDVLLSCGYDKMMHIYDIRLQKVVSTIRTAYTLTSLSINVENQVALGSKNGIILIYDLRDLVNPLKILRGHEDEICKVAFQPIRRKLLFNDTSLSEDVDVNTNLLKVQSPIQIRNRTSDLFFVTDNSPICNNNLDIPEQAGDNTADSFLVMLGLDKTNNECERSTEEKSIKHDRRHSQIDIVKNTTKASTPLVAKTPESPDFGLPLNISNGVLETRISNNNIHETPSVSNSRAPKIDVNVANDLKDFIKSSLIDISDDGRDQYLHIMMALTKEKLFLEKKLDRVCEQLQSVVNNQNALVEINRKLVCDIDQLKARLNLL